MVYKLLCSHVWLAFEASGWFMQQAGLQLRPLGKSPVAVWRSPSSTDVLGAGCAGSLFFPGAPQCFPTPRQLSAVFLGHAPGLVGPLCSSCASRTRQCADRAPRCLAGGMAARDGA